jgi:hypothetical protein
MGVVKTGDGDQLCYFKEVGLEIRKRVLCIYVDDEIITSHNLGLLQECIDTMVALSDRVGFEMTTAALLTEYV